MESAMSYIPILYTPRLTLRPFTLADGPRVRELAGDARIAATTANIPHPYPAGLAEIWIQSHAPLAQDSRQFTFAITLAGTRTPDRENDLLDTGHVIGAVSLILSSDLAIGRAELGYWIGVAYWHRGFATEAANAVLGFGFQRLGLRRVFARHVAHNYASGRVLEKLGMTHEGTLREQFVKDDQTYDLESYAILKDEWLRTRARHRFPAAVRPLQPAG
jgi:[ribosomal protein S5]-alanine N-acetyltransferase